MIPLFCLIVATAMGQGDGKSKNYGANSSEIVKKDGVEMVSHQLLVKFESENAALERQKIFKQFLGRELERVGTTPLFLVQFPEDTDIMAIKEKLERIAGISYAEPNVIMRAMPIPKKTR